MRYCRVDLVLTLIWKNLELIEKAEKEKVIEW